MENNINVDGSILPGFTPLTWIKTVDNVQTDENTCIELVDGTCLCSNVDESNACAKEIVAFANVEDNNMKSCTFSPNVNRLGESCFISCESLADVSSIGVSAIEESAFAYCTGISAVHLSVDGEAVATKCVKDGQFETCFAQDQAHSTTIISSEGDEGYTLSVFSGVEDTFNADIRSLFVLDDETEFQSTFKDLDFSATEGSQANVTAYVGVLLDSTVHDSLFDNSILEIESEIFDYDHLISFIDSNGNVISIDPYAFESIANISAICMDSVSSIGDCAFRNSSSLHVASFTSALSVGYYAFEYCTSLASVDLENAEEIKGGAFEYAQSLNYINIPNVKTIYPEAFMLTYSLQQLSAENATEIGNWAFGYSGIKRIYIPKAKNIGDGAFYGTNVISVDVSESLTKEYVEQNATCWLGGIDTKTLFVCSDGEIEITNTVEI